MNQNSELDLKDILKFCIVNQVIINEIENIPNKEKIQKEIDNVLANKLITIIPRIIKRSLYNKNIEFNKIKSDFNQDLLLKIFEELKEKNLLIQLLEKANDISAYFIGTIKNISNNLIKSKFSNQNKIHNHTLKYDDKILNRISTKSYNQDEDLDQEISPKEYILKSLKILRKEYTEKGKLDDYFIFRYFLVLKKRKLKECINAILIKIKKKQK
ncbi:MAG: hypothetical protein KatS3mg068_2328 [Candidatus Sericytochromatia bacterium]|nr:MAG: hypothetical protein KatS3mg068_2328 [Candidatus Sericytochromatia bacterium]